MTKKNKLRVKRRYIILGLALAIIVAVLVLLPGIARNYLVSHGEELTGRKLALEQLKVNYFEVSITARNFNMYELNGKDVFVHFDELYVNFEPWRLFQREYKFAEIRLVKPAVSVLYNGTGFNFSDFMTSDSTDVAKENEEPVRYVLQNLHISEGFVRYEDSSVPNVSELKNLNLNIPEIAWDNSSSKLGADFILGENGKVSVGGDIDQTSGRYVVKLKTENIDIEPYAAYFKPYVDASVVKGLLSTDLLIGGEMENPMNVKVFGEGSLMDFSMTGTDQQLVLSAKNAWTKIDSLDIAGWNFCFADIQVEEPGLTAVLGKEGTNLEKILAPYLADTLSTDTTVVHYSIRNLSLKGGQVAFSDLTLNRPFRFDITDLDFVMKDLTDASSEIPMEFSMRLNRSGEMKGKARIDMMNMLNVMFDGYVRGLDVVSFSPYSEYYLARPLTRGTFNYDMKLEMTPSVLKNENSIRIDKLEIGKKIKEKPVYKVPVGLALYVLKDRNDHIGFDLPVTGNPSSPKFKLRRIIWKTFEEFLLKTATQPINFIGNKLGVDPESIKRISFAYLQDSLESKQTESLDKIAAIITKKPDLTFSLVQTTDQEEEITQLAVRDAKALYAKSRIPVEGDQAIVSIPAVDDNDPGFLSFLGMTAEQADSTGELFRKSCIQKAGNEKLMAELKSLLEKRESLLKDYMASKGLPAESLRFKTSDLRNIPAELKKPQFIVEVSLE